jgi:predicted permease
MLQASSGFDSSHHAYVLMGAPPEMTLPQRLAFSDTMVERLSAVPGLRGVARGNPPVAGGTSTYEMVAADDPSTAALVPHMLFRVDADYFRVAGIPIEEGRAFGSDDRPQSEAVVIISDNAARRFWPGRSAIGRRILDGRTRTSYTVVGVVPHLKTIDLAKDGIEWFLPSSQAPSWEQNGSTLLLRTDGDLSSVASTVRDLIRDTDDRVIVRSIRPVDNLFAEHDPYGAPRFYSLMLGVMAGLGLVTAAVGLYGSLSFSVGQRTREIGVRMALGAGQRSVRKLVFGDAARPVAIGIFAGAIGAMWLSKFVASQLFHIAPRDPATFAAVIVLLAIVCAAAVFAPARRAARIDPAVALRTD